MSDTAKSKELLTRYSIARIPFIAINTIEPGRTLEMLKEISEDLQLPFHVHTLTKGVYDLATDKNLSDDKSVYGAIDYMTEQMKRKQSDRSSGPEHRKQRFQTDTGTGKSG